MVPGRRLHRGAPRHVLSPKIAAALLGQPRALLSARQAQTVDVLKQQCPGFTTMRRLVLSFQTILRVGKVASSTAGWIAGLPPTSMPCIGLSGRCDGTSARWRGPWNERWSNGPVEGHINRLKMLPRQMYGRVRKGITGPQQVSRDGRGRHRQICPMAENSGVCPSDVKCHS